MCVHCIGRQAGRQKKRSTKGENATWNPLESTPNAGDSRRRVRELARFDCQGRADAREMPAIKKICLYQGWGVVVGGERGEQLWG